MAVTFIQASSASWTVPDTVSFTGPTNQSVNILMGSPITTGNWLIAAVAWHETDGPATVSVSDDACNRWTPLVTSIAAPPLSYALNANPGFETGTTTGWTAINCTLAAVTNEALSGTYSCRITPNGTSSQATIQTGNVTVTRQQSYNGSLWAYAPSGYAQTRAFISWLTSASVFISTTFSELISVPAGGWTQINVASGAPSTAGIGVLGFQLIDTPQPWSIVYVDNFTLTSGIFWSSSARVSLWAAPNVRVNTTRIFAAPLGPVTALYAEVMEFSGLPTWLTAAPVASALAPGSAIVSTSITPTQQSFVVTAGANPSSLYPMYPLRSGGWAATYLNPGVTNGVDHVGDVSLVAAWQTTASPVTSTLYGLTPANTNPTFTSSTAGWSAVNSTLALSSGLAFTGPNSGLLTPNGTSATVTAQITHATAPRIGPGFLVLGEAQVQATGGAASVKLALEWLTSSRTTISTVVGTDQVIPADGTWHNLIFTGNPPAAERFVSLHIIVDGTPPATTKLNIGRGSISLAAVVAGSLVNTSGVVAAIQLTPTAPAQPSSTWPNLRLEVAFGQGASTPPDQLAYTDISDRLFAVTADRGKQYELNALQTAQLSFTLRNDDGALTPGNFGRSGVTAFNVNVYNPFRLSAVWQNQAYNICVGLMERWPQTWADAHFGLVPAIGVDVWAMMTPTQQTVVRQELLLDGPVGYWPLSDGAGASSAANLGTLTTPLLPLPTPGGAGSSVASFGASNVALVGDTNSNWGITGVTSSTNHFGTSLTYSNGPYLPPLDQGVTVHFWFHAPQSTAARTEIFTAVGAASPLFSLWMQASGQLNISTWSLLTGGETITGPTAASWSNFTTDCVITIVDVGGGAQQVTVYLNAIMQLQAAASMDPRWQFFNLNGRNDAFGVNFMGNMGFSHMAVYNHVVNFSRVVAWYFAGTNGLGGDHAGQRVSHLLSYLPWQPPQRIYSNVPSVVTAMTGMTDIGGNDVATNINNIAQTEQALLFIDRNGNLTYQSRQTIASRGVQVTLGERQDLGEIPYLVTLEADFDPQYVNNDIQITHLGTPPFIPTSSTTRATATTGSSSPTILIRNNASIDAYGDKSLQLTSYFSYVVSSVNLAAYLASQYANPMVRVAQVEVTPASNPTQFGPLLGLDIGDRVLLKRRPVGAPEIDLDVVIIGIHHDVERKSGKWSMKLDLVPTRVVALNLFALKLNDANLGKLDSGNVIGW